MRATIFTPDYTLTMLKEVKELSDKGKFSSIEFRKKYPSFYAFRKFIYSKGIMKIDFGREQWVSIEPNIIMAKELIKLYNSYMIEVRERHAKKVAEKQKQELKNQLSIEESTVADLTMVQPFNWLKTFQEKSFAPTKQKERSVEDLKEHLEAKQEELDEVFIKYEQLQSELSKVKATIIQLNLKILTQQQQLENKDQEVVNANRRVATYKKENESLTKKLSIKSNIRKIRLFGIAVFSIENK